MTIAVRATMSSSNDFFTNVDPDINPIKTGVVNVSYTIQKNSMIVFLIPITYQ